MMGGGEREANGPERDRAFGDERGSSHRLAPSTTRARSASFHRI
jgi:hypothetical protein